MRTITAKALLRRVPEVQVIYLEDVYFTGLVAQKAKIGHVNVSSKLFHRGRRYTDFWKKYYAFWLRSLSEALRRKYYKKLDEDIGRMYEQERRKLSKLIKGTPPPRWFKRV